MTRTASGGAKRRLTWAQLSSSQGSGELKCTDEAPISPVSGAFASCPAAVQDRAVVNSPIIDGALFLEFRRKARILQREKCSTDDEASKQQAAPGDAPSLPMSAQQPISSMQDLQQDVAQEPAAPMQQRDKPLAAAGSSSNRCLEMLCWGMALEQQHDSPMTPAAPSCVVLPAPPRKRAMRASLSVAGVPRKASRMLHGLAPACQADLQQVRTWLACQKVQ